MYKDRYQNLYIVYISKTRIIAESALADQGVGRKGAVHASSGGLYAMGNK